MENDGIRAGIDSIGLNENMGSPMGVGKITADSIGMGDTGNAFLPVKPAGFWNSFKGFWLQEVEQENFWFKDIKMTAEPYGKENAGEISKVLFKKIYFKLV